MKNASDSTPTMADLEAQVASRDEEIAFLREQIRSLKDYAFGKKSEKMSANEASLQPSLFELETSEDLDPEPASEEEPGDEGAGQPRPKKRRGGRRKLPDFLERKEHIIDLDSEDKICDCGCERVCIDKEQSEYLERTPPQLWVRRDIRLVYACQNPDCSLLLEGKPGVVKTPPPRPRMIPKSNAGDSLLSLVLISKFVDGLPFYRVQSQLRREGVDIPRQTMARWAIQVAEKMKPMWKMLLDELKNGGYLQMDETPLQVMNEDDKSNTSKSYMWVIRGGPPDHPIVFYNYDSSRASKVPMNLLEGYEGIVQTDGYDGYSFLSSSGSPCTHAGCINHMRRRFVKVAKAAGKKRKKGNADDVLKLIGKLYKVEREARRNNLSTQEVLALREQKSAPIMADIKEKLDYLQRIVPPRSLLGDGVAYALKQWPKLQVFLHHGVVKLDTNDVENAIRPFVVGRKAWLFSATPAGAEASAILYSMVETAKACGWNPAKWFAFAFENLPLAKSEEDYRQLLPSNPPPEIAAA
jgi:transposase